MPRISINAEAKGLLRSCLWFGLLLLIAALLQVTLLSEWRVMNCVPDLMLCCVVAIAFFCGTHVGAVCGIAGGFLIDALGSFGISVLPVFYLFCGYVVGHYARAMYPKRFSAYAMYASFSLLLRAAASVTLAAATYENVNLPQILLYSVLPELLLTLLLSLLLYLPMRGICSRWMRK